MTIGMETHDVYTVLSPASQSSDYKLHLVTLNNDILSAIEDGKDKLYLKASSSTEGYPVIVTDSRTFKIRQQNQSNCLMLMNTDKINGKDAGVSFDDFKSKLILEDVKPDVDMTGLITIRTIEQLRNTVDHSDDGEGYTLKDLFANSRASKAEFEDIISRQQIFEFRGCCYIAGDALVTTCIGKIVEKLIKQVVESGHELDIMEELNKFKYCEARKCVLGGEILEKHPKELIELCLRKFFGQDGINDDLIVRQFGLEVLRKHKTLKLDDFMIELKLRLPFNYTPQIKLNQALGGCYYTFGDDKLIAYLDDSMLSEDPVRRFEQLFSLKPQWEVTEIEPFIDSINKKGTKPEKFLLKFCKVKRVGKKHYAMPMRAS